MLRFSRWIDFVFHCVVCAAERVCGCILSGIKLELSLCTLQTVATAGLKTSLSGKMILWHCVW